MSEELEGQMPLFDLVDVQPDEVCEGCCRCKPEQCPPECHHGEEV